MTWGLKTPDFAEKLLQFLNIYLSDCSSLASEILFPILTVLCLGIPNQAIYIFYKIHHRMIHLWSQKLYTKPQAINYQRVYTDMYIIFTVNCLPKLWDVLVIKVDPVLNTQLS